MTWRRYSFLFPAESRADLNTTVGSAWLVLGKVDAAQAAFGEALTAVPDYGPAIFGQARIKAANRDFETALDARRFHSGEESRFR